MWLLTLYRSTIGKKVIMAVTGLMLVGFVIVHMAGNLQAFLGANKLNGYSAFLKSTGELLWLARLGLLAALIAHVTMALQLTQIARRARPTGYAKRIPQVSTLASRSMRWGGVLLLVFIVFHLLHFTTGTIFPMASVPGAAFSETDVYDNVISAFRTPWVVLVYVVAMFFLMLHLFHGAWSSVRTLGLTKPTPRPLERKIATAIALVVWLGFTVVPVAVFFGVIR
ncbi:MAG: succinate dehydrogenase (or fumarate reductase) cytochrome b subunit, b558 family [Gemmatimonadetes bacterium]|nr:succinate dehydrogenase (or fumarate reductase) cytochrome b subunit, b558 family [Gemmatimonadota bacterium]